MGGGDDPRVDLNPAVAADRLHGLVFEGPQQLRLAVERQLAELVEKQRAAAGIHEGTFAIAGGSCECAAHVAEKLRVEQFFADGAAIYDHERHGSSGRMVVNGPGRQLLAGAGLALDQDRRFGRRAHLEHREQLAHGQAAADQSAETVARTRRHGRHLARRDANVGGAKPNRRPAGYDRLDDPRALPEGTVGAAQVADTHALAGRYQLGVAPRNLRVFQGEVTVAPGTHNQRPGTETYMASIGHHLAYPGPGGRVVSGQRGHEPGLHERLAIGAGHGHLENTTGYTGLRFRSRGADRRLVVSFYCGGSHIRTPSSTCL